MSKKIIIFTVLGVIFILGGYLILSFNYASKNLSVRGEQFLTTEKLLKDGSYSEALIHCEQLKNTPIFPTWVKINPILYFKLKEKNVGLTAPIYYCLAITNCRLGNKEAFNQNYAVISNYNNADAELFIKSIKNSGCL